MPLPKPLPNPNHDGGYSFIAGMSVDADGANGADRSARGAYGPRGTNPLDFLANAGGPGNWWGVVTDIHGNPVVQGADDPAPGYYISTTSYQRSDRAKTDPSRYLDSATERFIVVPSHWRSIVPGVVLGCKAVVSDTETGEEIEGVVGDFGPRSHLGEASIAFAAAFNLNPNPKNGGTEVERFTYTFYPDVPAEGYELQPMH